MSIRWVVLKLINQYDNKYFHFLLTQSPFAATISLHKYLQRGNIIKIKNTYGITVYKKQKFVKLLWPLIVRM